MNFNLTPEQHALKESVARVCAAEFPFSEHLRRLRSSEATDHTRWRSLADLGWLGTCLPEDVGGIGGSAVEAAIILEEFGRALVTEPFLSNAMLAGKLIDLQGNESQRNDLLVPMIAGDLFLALAHGEPDADSCIEHVETEASVDASGTFMLNGHKSLVLGGPSATKILISARTNGAVRARSEIGVFILDASQAGLRWQHFRTFDGFAVSDVTLTNVRMPANCRLGGPNAIDAIEHAVDYAIVGLCAEAVGIMDSLLWATRDHLKSRSQFGVTLNTLQALQHRMADMYAEVELSRTMLYWALSGIDSQDYKLRRRSVAAAKVQIGRGAKIVAGNAVQLHGGMGVADDYRVGHYFKRLTIIGALFGNSDFHLERFAALSGCGADHRTQCVTLEDSQ
jgi:alkylation response protein AidB-like acyl-CoA dehydrogenase